MAHNSLQVNGILQGRKLNWILYALYMCYRFDEDIGHLFLKCKCIKLCWLLLNLEKVKVDLLKQGIVQDMLTKSRDFAVT